MYSKGTGENGYPPLLYTFVEVCAVLSPVLPPQDKSCDCQTGQRRVSHMVKGLLGERLREVVFFSLMKTKSKD